MDYYYESNEIIEAEVEIEEWTRKGLIPFMEQLEKSPELRKSLCILLGKSIERPKRVSGAFLKRLKVINNEMESLGCSIEIKGSKEALFDAIYHESMERKSRYKS